MNISFNDARMVIDKDLTMK